MRPKKIIKQKQNNILQEESLKLKEKLQLLKQQVTKKKIEKQMNKTTQATSGDELSKFLKPNIKNQTQYLTNDKKLYNTLCQLKIQAIQSKLQEKGITSLNQFLALEDSQIDQWKDIIVGYRIKMKKFIKMNKSQINITQSPTVIKKQSSIIMNKDKNIEDIIKNRQHNRVYIPLNREIQQIQNEQIMEQMTQQDQDVIIKSFLHIFHPRRGILKKQKKQSKYSVKWSQQVQKMQDQFKQKKHVKYPKQTIVKQILRQSSQKQCQRAKYCWQCIKKIQKTSIFQQQKIFCSQNCCKNYQQQIKTNLKILKDYHQKDQQFKKLQYQKIKSLQTKQLKQQDEDLELIDLSIL